MMEEIFDREKHSVISNPTNWELYHKIIRGKPCTIDYDSQSKNQGNYIFMNGADIFTTIHIFKFTKFGSTKNLRI